MGERSELPVPRSVPAQGEMSYLPWPGALTLKLLNGSIRSDFPVSSISIYVF